MYRIELTRTAEKELAKLYKRNKRFFKRINSALDAIAKDPYEGKSLKQTLKGCYSYRVGEYTIIYKIRKKQLIVVTIDAGHRREIYR